MLATIINSIGVVVGALLGLFLGQRINERIRTVVFAAAGIMSIVLGIMMCIKGERILYLAISLFGGGILGTVIGIEPAIERFGAFLHRLLKPRATTATAADQPAQARFAQGFLDSSVLFCIGSMAILGSIQAGTSGDYSILLTKTVMDSFVAMLMAAALGAGVAFSGLSILIYQGAITLAAGLLAPLMSDLVISGISGTGGAIVLMIGLNLLGLTRIPTGNFLVSLVLAIGFALADPWMPAFMRT